MGLYKDNVDLEPHNFNDTTITLKAIDSGDQTVLQGLHALSAKRKENRWETKSVASGMAMEVEKPSTEAVIEFDLFDPSPSTDWLWDHIDERIQIAVNDANSPKMNVAAKGRMQHTELKREGEPDVPKWQIVVPYSAIRGGSYNLVAAD
jgi:hypothetical protein